MDAHKFSNSWGQPLGQVFGATNGHQLVETGTILKVRRLQTQLTQVESGLALGSEVLSCKGPHIDEVSARSAKSSGNQGRSQRIAWTHFQTYEVYEPSLFPGGTCNLKVSPENPQGVFWLLHRIQPERSYSSFRGYC
jgi:hypothetical protein